MANATWFPSSYGDYQPTDYSTYKSHVVPTIIKDSVLTEAQGRLVFTPFVTVANDINKRPGDTIQFPIARSLPHAGTTALTSGTAIQTQEQVLTSVSISISEYGNSVGCESLLAENSKPDIPDVIRTKLAEDWALTLNYLCAAQFSAGSHHVSAMSGGTGTFDYDGTTRTVPTGTIDPDFVGTLRDKMVEGDGEHTTPKFNVPGFGEYFVFIASPGLLRPFKQSVQWENLQLYANDGAGIFNSQVGVYEEFLFLETKVGMTDGEGYAFGRDAVGLAFAKDMELWEYPDFAQDAGRNYVWKWLSWLGAGPLMANAGTNLWVVNALGR